MCLCIYIYICALIFDIPACAFLQRQPAVARKFLKMKPAQFKQIKAITSVDTGASENNIAVKELTLSYYSSQTVLLSIYPHCFCPRGKCPNRIIDSKYGPLS